MNYLENYQSSIFEASSSSHSGDDNGINNNISHQLLECHDQNNKNITENSSCEFDSIHVKHEMLDTGSNLSKTEELRNLLNSWNLEQLTDHLVCEKVFVNVLKVMKRRHIDKLLCDFEIGTQILFEHHLEHWRASLGIPLTDGENFNTSNVSVLPPTTSNIVTNQSRFVPYVRPTTPDDGDIISLSNVLSSNAKGVMLATYYDMNKKFQDEQRTSLVNLISQHFEEKGVSMSLNTSYRLENEILERFPTEKLEFYRTKKRGKLYNRFNNFKSTFTKVVERRGEERGAKKAKKLKLEKRTRYQQEFCPEPGAEAFKKALKCETLTTEQFDDYWRGCVQSRLNDIKRAQSYEEIHSRWPYYKPPSGYRLIEMDFDVAFNNGCSFRKNFKRDMSNIVSFLRNNGHIKDKIVKSLLEKLNDGFLPENSRYTILLLALHGYFVPTNKKIEKDNKGKVTTTKFSIKESQDSFLHIENTREKLENHMVHLKSKNKSIQPVILCVSDDIINATELNVYFDEVSYKLFHIIRAVDLCFKIIYLFNLDFPPESEMFWTFIEYHYFKIKGRNSFSKVHVLSEFLKENRVSEDENSLYNT
ncbi:hypothetical protein FQR65_LT01966 [Abscondita terminalis]|nr:hypothetical protein FQR65_LT01966 [Abscondita terminalis]